MFIANNTQLYILTDTNNKDPKSKSYQEVPLLAFPEFGSVTESASTESYNSEHDQVLMAAKAYAPVTITTAQSKTLNDLAESRRPFQMKIQMKDNAESETVNFAIYNGFISSSHIQGDYDQVVQKSYVFEPQVLIQRGVQYDIVQRVNRGMFGLGANGVDWPQDQNVYDGNSLLKNSTGQNAIHFRDADQHVEIITDGNHLYTTKYQDGTVPVLNEIYSELNKPTPSEIGAIPISERETFVPRTLQVNGHQLVGNIQLHAADLGDVYSTEQVNGLVSPKLNKAGDIMSGSLTFGTSNPTYDIISTSNDLTNSKKYLRQFRSSRNSTIWHETVDGGQYRIATGKTDSKTILMINDAGQLWVDGGRAYTTAFKPTFSDIGAVPSTSIGTYDETAVPWNAPTGIYTVNYRDKANNVSATNLLLQFYSGGGISCPTVQFKTSYRNGVISYRTSRDAAGFEEPFTAFYTEKNPPTAAACKALPITGGTLSNSLTIQKNSGQIGLCLIHTNTTAGYSRMQLEVQPDGVLDIATSSNGTTVWNYPLKFYRDNANVDVGGILTVKGQCNITGSVNSTTGNFWSGGTAGGSWTSWQSRNSALAVDCPDSDNSAYNIWKATKPGKYDIASMLVHCPGGVQNNAIVRIQAGTDATFDFNGAGDQNNSGSISANKGIILKAIEANEVSLRNDKGTNLSGDFVGYTQYKWYSDVIKTGVTRSGSQPSLGYAIDINGTRRLVLDTATGNLMTTGSMIGLKSDHRRHFCFWRNDGSVDMYLWKDFNGDGVHLTNGADGGGDWVFGKNASLTCPGNVSCQTLYQRSDERVKSNIEPLSDVLAKLTKIHGYSYVLNGENQIGLIAQEVQPLFPDLVIEQQQYDQDGNPTQSLLALNYSGFSGVLVQAVNDLNTIQQAQHNSIVDISKTIDQLQQTINTKVNSTDIDALVNRITALENRITALENKTVPTVPTTPDTSTSTK
ncbi:tail fiber domain-containing protein [Edwardsiella piscicida]|uniref:tail fiber domain-containing protein n=1 Tax=Edwardsiella piscicida TaxID=1263550 RepID=UPI0010575BAE|nr:tail fiber domain-containing protein [Edwardsiella piscicida]UCQ40053.1 tail fiber domain-containing protein [Edwardsiella piscicida]